MGMRCVGGGGTRMHLCIAAEAEKAVVAGREMPWETAGRFPWYDAEE